MTTVDSRNIQRKKISMIYLLVSLFIIKLDIDAMCNATGCFPVV